MCRKITRQKVEKIQWSLLYAPWNIPTRSMKIHCDCYTQSKSSNFFKCTLYEVQGSLQSPSGKLIPRRGTCHNVMRITLSNLIMIFIWSWCSRRSWYQQWNALVAMSGEQITGSPKNAIADLWGEQVTQALNNRQGVYERMISLSSTGRVWSGLWNISQRCLGSGLRSMSPTFKGQITSSCSCVYPGLFRMFARVVAAMMMQAIHEYSLNQWSNLFSGWWINKQTVK